MRSENTESASSSALREVSRPLGLVERLQVTMENLGVGSIFHLGAALIHPYSSDQEFIDHMQRRVQLMLDEIPALSTRIELRETQSAHGSKNFKGGAKVEPHMVCDRSNLFLAPQVASTSITTVSIPSGSSGGAVWESILPLATQSSHQRVQIRGGPLWSVDFFQLPRLEHDGQDEQQSESRPFAQHKRREDHHRTVYLFLSCSHALVDGRGSRNILDALINTDPLLLSPLDIRPLYSPFEDTGLAKMNMAVFWNLLSTALMVLLPLLLKKLFGLSEIWPNHFKPTAFKITQVEGNTRMRTIVLSREQVRALKAAASTNARTGRCTLHATINESMKIAVIAADRAHERAVQQRVALPLPSRLNYHFASQNPIDMRTGDDSRSYGRFAGNHFGMKVMPVSNRTDVRFWAEAVAFNTSIGSPATKRTAAATLSVLGFIPSKEGWVDEDGVAPGLYTGWEHFFHHSFKRPAKFTGTCNYSNLGLVAQPRAGAGSVLLLVKGLPVGAIKTDLSGLAIPVRPSLITEKSMGNLSDIFPTPTDPSDVSSKQPHPMVTAVSTTAMGELLPPFSFTSAAAELEVLDTVKENSCHSPNGKGLEGGSIISDNTAASDSAEFARSSSAQAIPSPSNSSFSTGSTLVHTPSITASNTMTQKEVKAFARFALHPTSDADQALPTFLVDEVFFIQTVQPGSCAFYIDVAGCAVAPLPTMTSDGQGYDGAAAAGGAVTISVTWIEGHLPEPCAETFVAALRSGLALCASGGIGPDTTVGQAVEEVERIVDQV